MPIRMIVRVAHGVSDFRDLTPPRRDIVELDIQSRSLRCDGDPGLEASGGCWSGSRWGEHAWRVEALAFSVRTGGVAGLSCGCR